MPQAFRFAVPTAVLFALLFAPPAEAQISFPSPASARGQATASLEDQLINRLRATAEEQQAFIRFVAARVREDKLERGLVLAIERYALKRNRLLPFNYFARAMRFEASRRGVSLPPVQQFVTTQVFRSQRRNR